MGEKDSPSPLGGAGKLDSEKDAEFLTRVGARLAECLGEEDGGRLIRFAKRGVETQWRLLSEAPDGEIEVLAYREDAGVFTAFRTEMNGLITRQLGIKGSENIWHSTNGENLASDLPTHFIALKTLGIPPDEC